jgi:DNA-binding LacI/PurR family transcriptional regulator
VLQAARELGYVPNHAARSLRRQRTNVITFMTSELGNPYFAEVAAAAQKAALLRGYVIDNIAAGSEAAGIEALSRLCFGGTSDGLVIHGGSQRICRELRRLSDQGFGCVLVQDASEEIALPCVRVDLVEGARLATHHLLALGHRRIAHLTDVRLHRLARNDRLAGYRQALAEAGLSFDPTLVGSGDNNLAGGEAAMRALLRLPGPRPSAVFVFNDQMAIGALHALRMLGLRVPDDMALVGFDGTDIGAFTAPTLTTVDHPRRDLGRLAADTLIDLLEGKPPDQATRTLPVQLVIRKSCGAVPD